MVLNASYEATLRVGVEQAREHGGEKGAGVVYLTQLGGGVFGNADAWIDDAIELACDVMKDEDLHVVLVNYSGKPSARQAALKEKYPAYDRSD